MQISTQLGEADLADFEWIKEGKGYREWLIDADLLNARSVVREVSLNDVLISDRDRLAGLIRRYRARKRAEVRHCEREIGGLARQLRDFQLGLKRKPKRSPGRPKQLSTQGLREAVCEMVAAGLEATDEELRTLMTERQRQRWARRILPDRMRSKVVHRAAAEHYCITMADVRRFLDEEHQGLLLARSKK